MPATLALVLHAHLPYLRDPDGCLEEDWLYEAVAETYLPLLWVFRRLRDDRVPANVALSFSPTLCAMLDDPLLRSRCRTYLSRRAELCAREARRQASGPLAVPLAFFRERFTECLRTFDGCEGNLLGAYRELRDSGTIELLTTTATHAVLPLLTQPEAVRAQVRVAAKEHRRRFGGKSAGLWLAECAYDARLGPVLSQAGFDHCFLDGHALELARPQPRCGPYAPIRLPASAPEPVFAFGRDGETARQVWSAAEGYPGHAAYREFHRDLGFDAPLESVAPLLHGGARHPVGVKCHRVTGAVGLGDKAPYDPAEAARVAAEHAEHFLRQRALQAERLTARLKTRPVIGAFFDAELFGHWWFEGPQFLEALLRRAAAAGSAVAVRTPSWILDNAAEAEAVEPEASTWGDKGYLEVWLNDSNDWMLPHVHGATERMVALANRFGPQAKAHPTALEERALNQCAREVLLVQASDWPFLLAVRSHARYARRRFERCLESFLRLQDQLERRAVDEAQLRAVESRDAVFPELDFRVFTS